MKRKLASLIDEKGFHRKPKNRILIENIIVKSTLIERDYAFSVKNIKNKKL